MRTRYVYLVVAILVAVVGVAAAVRFVLGHDAAADQLSHNPPVSVVTPAAPGNLVPYEQAIASAGSHGLHVWLETDLVKRWRAGATSFQQGIDAIAQEAKDPAVVGVKVADELGYHDGLSTSHEIQAFLDATASALRARVSGKLILVDVVVPELGCMPGHQPSIQAAVQCDKNEAGYYPQLSLPALDSYVQSHTIDVLDVSTYLQSAATYSGWGTSIAVAQSAAWQEIGRRGWSKYVTLNGRKALAHPGKFSGTPTDAEASLQVYVDIPLQFGAHAVDIWTWRQLYEGQIYRLMDPGSVANPLWTAIIGRHDDGVALFTHFSPSSVESNVDGDMKLIATAFTDVFIAAGTG